MKRFIKDNLIKDDDRLWDFWVFFYSYKKMFLTLKKKKEFFKGKNEKTYNLFLVEYKVLIDFYNKFEVILFDETKSNEEFIRLSG